MLPGKRWIAGFWRKIASSSPGIGRSDLGCIEAAEASSDLERPGERLLNRDLLVEDEPDEQRERLLGEEAIGLVVAREVEVRRPSHLPCPRF